jgi:site-specific DNA recombinase
MRVVGYVRVSTNEQEDNNSLQDQEDSIRAFCKSQKWEVTNIYKDVASGSNLKRGGFLELTKDLWENGIDGIVVYKLDRLSRSIVDGYNFILKELELRNKFLKSVTEGFIDTSSSHGKMFLSMMFTFAEYERNLITDRMKQGREHRAKKGIKSQGSIYGYVYDAEKIPVINEDEAVTVKKIFKLYKQEKSLGRVKALLDRESILNRSGKPFSRQALHFILKNSFYTGILKQGKIDSTGIHKPIISKILYNQVNQLLSRD